MPLRARAQTAASIAAAALLLGSATGYIAPFSGRFMTLLDPTYAKKYIPIIASVAGEAAARSALWLRPWQSDIAVRSSQRSHVELPAAVGVGCPLGVATQPPPIATRASRASRVRRASAHLLGVLLL
jgi:hypothetical protein